MPPAPKHTRRWFRLSVGAMLYLPLVAAVGCVPDFGGERECVHLSYKTFRAKLPQDTLDPKGASDIDYCSRSTRDGHDTWLRMTIPAADCQAARDAFARHVQPPEFAAYKREQLAPVRMVTGNGPTLPSNWPPPDSKPPGWWELPTTGRNRECTYWELQVDNSPYAGRSKGWYWLYDRDASILWIWEWNRQHFNLGGERHGKAETSAQK